MSRGPGRVQRELLALLSEQPAPDHMPNVAPTIRALTRTDPSNYRYWRMEDLGPWVYRDWSDTAAQRRALQRAIRVLWLAGRIDTGQLRGGREHRVVVFGRRSA